MPGSQHAGGVGGSGGTALGWYAMKAPALLQPIVKNHALIDGTKDGWRLQSSSTSIGVDVGAITSSRCGSARV
jgi:hypothetical protein